jgi:hypothetical protein
MNTKAPFTFVLVGTVHYATGSCRDSRSFEVRETFKSPDEEEAKKEGKKRADRLYSENKNRTDFSMTLELKKENPAILKFCSVDERSATRSQSAEPAIEAHLACTTGISGKN